jgi:hypothetical protein
LEASSSARDSASQKPSPPSFNNVRVDFDGIEVMDIDEDAFAVTKDNKPRGGPASARKAKSRAVNEIAAAILSTGNEHQQALALRDTLAHPTVIKIAKLAGFESEQQRVALFNMKQQSRFLVTAMETDKSKGRATDDKRSFAQSMLVAIAPSPESRKVPSMRDRAAALGLPKTSGTRLLKLAENQRRRLRNLEPGLSWSRVKARLGHSKVTPIIRQKLHEWILDHPHVIDSPIAKDCLWIKDPEAPEGRKRVGKLLLEISVRELHNDLVDTPENGGLAEARDESGNVLISDTALRYLLPPQLKRMSASHKQMCGCEKCLSIQTLQQSLNTWRFRCLRQLSVEVNSLPEGEARQLALARLVDYRIAVLVDDKPIHPKPKIALKSIQCMNVDNFNFPHWNCVLRRCSVCPQYPIHLEEQGTNNDAPTISFHVYLPVTNCTQHGRLPDRAKMCPSCDADDYAGKKGKVRTRKHLTLLSRPIGTFLEEFYLPALDVYAYHQPHCQILGRGECGALRQLAFLSKAQSIKTIRDYTERLNAAFDQEIQSEHFGNSRSLSIEGCAVEMVVNVLEGESKLEFHSHFSDESRQDACMTMAHMEVLIEHLWKEKHMAEGSTMWDNTDGCGKQYRCGNALYFLSVLAVEHGIIIDRAIGAPGHGKDIVDGINAIDKEFLRSKMCMIGTPEASIGNKRMAAHSMVEGASKSLAQEALRLCADASRLTGVKSERKYSKREENSKLKLRHYHLQKPEDVKYCDVKMMSVGLPKGTHNGILAHYNLRCEKDLGIGVAAVRRIPCACAGCLEQLAKRWQPGVQANQQPRYVSSTTCHLWPIFEGLNDWIIITLEPTASTSREEIEETWAVALEGIATRMAEKVEVGMFGTFQTDDPDADGYYLVEWTSVPYTVQDNVELTEYDPPIQIEKGELVCDGKYWNKVPRAKLWYTRPTEPLPTVVRMQQVVSSKVELESISELNQLPHNCDRRTATHLGAKRISNEDHDEMLEEIHQREALEFDEDSDDEEAFDSNDSESESESEESDTAECVLV